MSLNLRIIFSASLVLAIFITLTAAALERAFVDSAETALRDKLTTQLYALMAATEVSASTIVLPSSQLDVLLGLPSSGVYATITDIKGKILWQSQSALGTTPPQPLTLASGKKRFTEINTVDTDFYLFAYGVNWATETNGKLDARKLTFNIATDLDTFNKQISQYRSTLLSWLLAMAVLLLVSQTIILRWGLSPLRKVGTELNRIETGEQSRIEAHYPREIEQLTTNINILLQQERDHKIRYRNALGDLAHSLKTPLAVLQAGLGNPDVSPDKSLQDQINRMNAIVEYQLQRAATAGSTSMSQLVDVNSVVERILTSMQKIYHDKKIKTQVNLATALPFKGDEGDLMEVVGNLLDNAFKWASSRVEVVVEQHAKKISIHVHDDGPGIAPEQREDLLQRGVRADQAVAGHGIGLSIVRTIVDAYQGELSIHRSPLGGCEIRVII